LLSGIAQAQETATVRVTFYVDRGTTASGTQARAGVAACSYGWEIGTRFRFADGRIVTCEDRGRLGPSHLDVWVPTVAAGRAEIAQVYGNYAAVEVLR
jgi:hypothetical protein